jgi:hypothetical protein
MAQRMSGDTTQNMVQDNSKNTTDVSLILESFSRDDMPGENLEANGAATTPKVESNPAPKANTAVVMKKESSNKTNVKTEKTKSKVETKKTPPLKKTVQQPSTQKSNDYK